MDENQSPKTVLIADDDDQFRAMIGSALEQAGFKVVTASDGEEALQKAREVRPNMMLLDIMMPKKLGFEVLEAVKNDSELKEIPVITLSHLAQPNDVEKVKNLGGAEHLVKTDFTIKNLIEKVRAYALG